MKNLILIFLFIPLLAFGQSPTDHEFKFLASQGSTVINGELGTRNNADFEQTRFGYALRGNGTDTYVSFPDAVWDQTGDETLVFWFKANTIGESNDPRLYDGTIGGFAGLNVTNNKFQIRRSSVTTVLSGNDAFEYNKWAFILVTSTSTGVTNIYTGNEDLSPSLSGSADQAGGTPIDGGVIYIGNRSSQDKTFDGQIGDITIYPRILSTTEINSLWDDWVKSSQTDIDPIKRNNEVVYHNDFSQDPVGSTHPKGFVQGTGSYVVDEIAVHSGSLLGSSWSLTTGWSESGDTLTANNVVSYLSAQNIVSPEFSVGKRYRITCKIVSTAGKVNISYGSQAVEEITTTGTNYVDTSVVYLSGTIRLYFKGYDGFTGEITDITLEEIPPLDNLTSGSKVLECTSSGTIAFPSTQAYGDWYFTVYKGGDGNITSVQFIDDGNGYSFQLYNNETVRLRRTGLNLYVSSSSYISNDTWYRVKINRTPDGEFTMWIKGGLFGDVYTLIEPSGVVGTNPLTDNTYTTSQYSVLDLDTGDKAGNFKISK